MGEGVEKMREMGGMGGRAVKGGGGVVEQGAKMGG